MTQRLEDEIVVSDECLARWREEIFRSSVDVPTSILQQCWNLYEDPLTGDLYYSDDNHEVHIVARSSDGAGAYAMVRRCNAEQSVDASGSSKQEEITEGVEMLGEEISEKEISEKAVRQLMLILRRIISELTELCYKYSHLELCMEELRLSLKEQLGIKLRDSWQSHGHTVEWLDEVPENAAGCNLFNYCVSLYSHVMNCCNYLIKYDSCDEDYARLLHDILEATSAMKKEREELCRSQELAKAWQLEDRPRCVRRNICRIDGTCTDARESSRSNR